MDIQIPNIDEQEAPMEIYGQQLLEWLAKAVDSREIRIKGIKTRISELALECSRLEDKQDTEKERILTLLNELGKQNHNIPGVGTFYKTKRKEKIWVSDNESVLKWAIEHRPEFVETVRVLNKPEVSEYAKSYMESTGELLEGFWRMPESEGIGWRR